MKTMSLIKRIFVGIAFLLALIFLADWFVLKVGDKIERDRCRPFEAVSNDVVLNERLRAELTDFINDEANRHKLDGALGLKFTLLTEYDFATAFSWMDIFDEYPAHKPELELALSVDPEMQELAPPYRITEIGLYGARSLLMYKNENPDQYMGGAGAVRLSEKPYIKCPVSFSHGVPVE